MSTDKLKNLKTKFEKARAKVWLIFDDLAISGASPYDYSYSAGIIDIAFEHTLNSLGDEIEAAKELDDDDWSDICEEDD